jgi:hypothetical protein
MMKRLALALLASAWFAGAQAQQCITTTGTSQILPLQVSGTGTTGAVSATLTGAAGKFTYLCGFMITSAGATTGTVRAATVTGTGSTLTFEYLDPSSGQGFLGVALPVCYASNAQNTNIVVTVPGTGTGTVGMAVTVWGCLQ